MVSVCTVPARGGRSCEHFGGNKTLNRIPLWFDGIPPESHKQRTIVAPSTVRCQLLLILCGCCTNITLISCNMFPRSTNKD